MISASAPTKIILIGEHSVVYGKRGITLPMKTRTFVTIKNNQKKRMKIELEDRNMKKHKGLFLKYVDTVLQAVNKKNAKLHIHVKNEAPIGIGLGVSASLAVALIKSIYVFFSIPLNETKLMNLTHKLEVLSHGTPSGIDHTTIILNKPLLFQKKGQSLSYKKIPEILKSSLLKNCYLINTGKPEETTREMVNFVANKHKKNPLQTKKIFNELDTLVDDVHESVKNEKEDLFAKSINRAGVLLEKLDIISQDAKKISKEIRNKGGAVKISGAGGKKNGSGILFVYHPDTKIIEKIAKKSKMLMLRIS